MDMRRVAGRLVRKPGMRVLIAAVVVKDTARNDAEMFGEVEGCGDYEEGEEEKKHRVYSYTLAWIFSKLRIMARSALYCGTEMPLIGVRLWICRMGNVLKMNFSVLVNMYSENVTSYWYLLRWNQRSSADG